MVYTAIFEDKEHNLTYELFDAPHGFSSAWRAIQDDVQDGRCLIAIVPDNHQVGFYNNILTGPSPFSGTRRLAAWSVR